MVTMDKAQPDPGFIDFSRFKVTCSNCNLSELCLPRGINKENLNKLADAIRQTSLYESGQFLFRAGDSFKSLIAIRTGTTKLFVTDETGEEQILGFYFPGEILGLDAFYERLEQFSHMELFSTKPGDTVIIFEQKNPHNTLLSKNLKKAGVHVIQPTTKYNDKISQFLFYTFFSQLVPLFLAKKKQQKECHFVTAKKLRKISDNMIY